VVLKVDPNEEKISLGMKQIEEDPWLALPVKYPTGTSLGGTVRNLTSFGAFVEIEPGIDGLVHVSDMSWTKRVEHPSEVVQKGEEVQVMVLDVDAENKRISLGIKQLLDDPWPAISDRFAEGVESDGTVVRVQEKGLVVDLGDDIEGFVPGSHAGIEDAAELEEFYDPADPIGLRVIESDAANRRIVLEATTQPTRKPPKPKVEEDAGEDGEGPEAEAAVAAVAAEAPAADAAEQAADDAPPTESATESAAEEVVVEAAAEEVAEPAAEATEAEEVTAEAAEEEVTAEAAEEEVTAEAAEEKVTAEAEVAEEVVAEAEPEAEAAEEVVVEAAADAEPEAESADEGPEAEDEVTTEAAEEDAADEEEEAKK